MLPVLPIDAVLPELAAVLRQGSCAVLQAPTGAGKTTRVPPALLDAALGPGRILLLEPRRIAARAAARRMAQERGGRVGDEIGYQVRFDRQWGRQTRIIAVTPGIVLQMLQDDPYLEQTAAVLFDEFHERSLECDLVLGMVRLIQQTVRPELRIVAMSATLAVETVSAYLGNCPIVASAGRLHPVEIVYQPRSETTPWPVATALAVEQLLQRTDGDLLVFLAGMQEIRQTARQLEPLASKLNLAILPLHGDLPPEQQDAALLPQSRRKVVLATNVAETSVTVEGVTGVVDTGLARTLVFNPSVGLDRLRLMPISKAAADQRSGRAGRTRPGVCIRLWSNKSHQARPDQTEPEIRRVDLAGAVLQLLCLGEANLDQFPWLEPPPLAAQEQARALLHRLGATNQDGPTERGRRMERLPVHPRLARLLIEGEQRGVLDATAMAAAMLAERDPFARSLDERRLTAPPTRSDLLDRVEALETFARTGRTQTPLGELNRTAARLVVRSRDQLVRAMRPAKNADAVNADAFGQALLTAYPDRLARRREPGSRRGVMAAGRGVRLGPSSGVVDTELFLCLDVDAAPGEAVVRLASGVERSWLPPDQLTSEIAVEFDTATERVSARKRLRFGELLLEESPAHLPADGRVAQVLIEAALTQLDHVLPAPDTAAGQYLLRLRCLSAWQPQVGLPALGQEEIHEILTWLAPGCRSFTDLRNARWLDAIQGRLSHAQRQLVEREAPERLEMPSGSSITLHYELGRPPVLAVRIQELFGLHETPRIAAGKIPVLLHLLGPNYRPQQVTDDLASFWANTYPQVRKDLRARYPRHAWPEDPWNATAERRPRRRTS
jgi:ATP-dependent helicase HrpB